ncbi:MAG: hypothetical protein V1746_05295 [bacterium]
MEANHWYFMWFKEAVPMDIPNLETNPNLCHMKPMYVSIPEAYFDREQNGFFKLLYTSKGCTGVASNLPLKQLIKRLPFLANDIDIEEVAIEIVEKEQFFKELLTGFPSRLRNNSKGLTLTLTQEELTNLLNEIFPDTESGSEYPSADEIRIIWDEEPNDRDHGR